MWGDVAIGEPVFTSRKKKGHLKEMQVNRIVKAVAKRVPGLEAAVAKTVSPHWLRPAHASYAMDRGALVHLVKETPGHANIATTGRYLHARPTDSSSLYLESREPPIKIKKACNHGSPLTTAYYE